MCIYIYISRCLEIYDGICLHLYICLGALDDFMALWNQFVKTFAMTITHPTLEWLHLAAVIHLHGWNHGENPLVDSVYLSLDVRAPRKGMLSVASAAPPCAAGNRAATCCRGRKYPSRPSSMPATEGTASVRSLKRRGEMWSLRVADIGCNSSWCLIWWLILVVDGW